MSGKIRLQFTNTQISEAVFSVVRKCSRKRNLDHQCDYESNKITYSCRICKKWVCKNGFQISENICLKCFRYNQIVQWVVKHA